MFSPRSNFPFGEFPGGSEIMIAVHPTLQHKIFEGNMYGVSVWHGYDEYQGYESPIIQTPFFITGRIPDVILTNPFGVPVIVRAEHDNSSLMLGDDLEMMLEAGEALRLSSGQLEETALSDQELYGVLHFIFKQAYNDDDNGICEFSGVDAGLMPDVCTLYADQEVHFSIAYTNIDTLMNIFNNQPDDRKRFEVSISGFAPAMVGGPWMMGMVAGRVIDGIISTTDDLEMIKKMLHASVPVC